ncbi:hypothetical protein [Adhaeretor mobilis]|uniref:Uncharacterized protein n=1 Tax=Adhaeretor mobilis TaxID=1930276 RepID=A0A517N2T2_9BACT|nr:hypothetical protein [Adhaeretor mobilis]QDT01446.1 hypothetical protein HG15A2_47880 [Adhaeretor mobilis]
MPKGESVIDEQPAPSAQKPVPHTPEISGRLAILVCVGLAAAVAAGGAWFRVSSTDDCVKFWGAEGARLVAEQSHVELLELGSRENAKDWPGGFKVVARHELTGKPGMVHFRNAMTLDRNFHWNEQREEQISTNPDRWRQALVFSGGEQQLTILLDQGYKHWGRVTGDGQSVLVTPAVNLDRMTSEYFGKVE